MHLAIGSIEKITLIATANQKQSSIYIFVSQFASSGEKVSRTAHDWTILTSDTLANVIYPDKISVSRIGDRLFSFAFSLFLELL